MRSSENIMIIAGREISTRAKERSFVISTVLMVAAIVVGAVVWSFFAGRESSDRIGVVGGDSALTQTLTRSGEIADSRVTVETVPDATAARQKVDDDDLDAVVLVGPDHRYTILSESGTGSTLDGVLRSGLAQYQLATSLAERGVAVTDLPSASIVTEQINPEEPDVGQRISIALIGSILLMMAVMTGGVMVAVGVVEEKTSRIVEILLSSVRPLQLLWGKILGIGAISLGQVVLLGATALVAGTATGLLTVTGTATAMFAAVIAWFLLGFLFFAALYAAVGAMVSRQEELNGASTPLTFLALGVLYAGMFGIQALDSTWMQVLSWIPPFSAVLMPIRIATGDTTALQVIGTFAVMIVVCAAAIWASSRIYSRSVLRTGTRTSWSEVAGMLTGRG
ncbi:ABC transporter permease [Gordonia iterans]|uniref:ABC transporter permease n=1 Tax=Gordonia iterans TaxID=1004901 RepID=A0A2S0KDE7_9ACTN|nr:ABC transporter permease [Gordonia iterans]AVL99702.1 ABC transporter permease [Gordonia iterans]